MPMKFGKRRERETVDEKKEKEKEWTSLKIIHSFSLYKSPNCGRSTTSSGTAWGDSCDRV